MGTSRNAELDELLAHASWLRRLARQLVKQQMDVDDLAQETWAATLRRPPGKGRPPRPWLAEVMRNLVRMRMRGERRRRARESDAAGSERTGVTSEELVARMERQREVAELVMALDEPYRSTILLRFYEEKSTREIAALQGVAVATVRWRLGEAVDRLRRELHRRLGGQSSEFLAALVPIASPWRVGEWLQGVTFMAAAKTNAKLAVLATLGIALFLLGGGLCLGGRGRTLPEGMRAGAGAGENATPKRPPVLPSLRTEGPLPVRGVLRDRCRYRSCDPDGAPAADVFVALSRALGSSLPSLAATARTDARGRCRFADVPTGRYALTASSNRRTVGPAVESGIEVAAGATRTVRLVLTRGGYAVTGTVTDRGAGAIGGATVTALLAAPAGDATGALRHFLARTDEQGAFAMTLAPGFYSLLAHADGYPRGSQFLPLDADTTVSFVLDPGAALSGRVVLRDTRARVPGARVQAVPKDPAGYRRPGVQTDADGTFTLNGVAPGEWQLQARKGPLTGSTALLRVIPALPISDLEILVDRAFTISGRVLGPEGQGMDQVVVVAELRGTTLGSGARTAADGAFRIEGLVPGHYELGAQTNEDRPRAHGDVVITDGDVAGVELRMPAAVVVQGRVVDNQGQPVSQARVYALMGQGAGTRDLRRGSLASTDVSGAFAFRGLDPGGLTLRAERQEIGVATWGPVAVRAGEVKQVTLRLTGGAAVRGRVLYPDGAPAAGATVSVRSPEGRGRITQALVAPDGSYLAAGRPSRIGPT